MSAGVLQGATNCVALQTHLIEAAGIAAAKQVGSCKTQLHYLQSVNRNEFNLRKSELIFESVEGQKQ